jgi:hypothetical protein
LVADGCGQSQASFHWPLTTVADRRQDDGWLVPRDDDVPLCRWH